MARTVIAVFESVYSAKKAIWELVDLGFPRERIDLFAEHSPVDFNELAKPEKIHSEVVIDEMRAGANIGAGIGGAIGTTFGLLMSLGALHIPRFMASLASGPVAVVILLLALAGLSIAAGALAGSLMSGLVGLGIPEEEIFRYAKNVREGNVTVMIIADWDAVDGTLEILGHHNPLELKQKSMEWQKSGLQEKRVAERARHIKVPGQDRPR